MLHSFESFVPKNIEKHQEDYYRKFKKEIDALNQLAKQLKKTIEEFKNIIVEDEREQFFIDKFKDCKVKIDYKKYGDIIFFFDQNDKYLGEYNSKQENFWLAWELFEHFELNYKNTYSKIKELFKTLVEQYFRLGSVKNLFEQLENKYYVEQHFKNIQH